MPRLIVCFFIGFAANAFAFTHVSPSAETLRPGQIAFQPYPGSNPIQDYAFLTNSLSIGVLNGLEIGTVPVMWRSTATFSQKNFNWKNRLWRSQEWAVGWGTQHLFYETKGESKQDYDSLRVDQVAISIEHRPIGSNFQFRYNLASSQLVIQGLTWMRFADGTSTKIDNWFVSGGVDHYLDIDYASSETNFWILGLSRNHEWLSGLGTKDEPGYGIGLSHAWRIRRSFISGLSLGFHVRERSGAKTLASVVF